MGTKRLTYDQLQQIVSKAAVKLANKYQNYDGQPAYAYSAGYLESMTVSMLSDLPAAKQQFYIKLLEAK
jgi:hypothetical protein